MKKCIPSCEICGASLEGKNYKGRTSYPRTCSNNCKRSLISKERTKIDPATGKKKSELSAIKASETMRNQVVNGKTMLQLRAEKASRTMEENQIRKVASEKRLKTMEENGEFLIIGEKIRNGMNKIGDDGLTRAQHGARNAKEKMRETFEETGRWIKSNEIEEFEKYLREVRSMTEKQQLSILPNYELRGHVSVDGYHLDHKFSIYDGFKHSVPPEKIANIKNLQFIHWKENVKKNHKSSITIEEVMSF
mgnify:CR=1 FL=1